MTSKTFKLLAVIAVIGFLTLPEIVQTQGVVGRVLNRRLRRVYPNLGNVGEPGSAFADPALLPGDVLLIAGNITEPMTGVVIPAGWFGTIVSETRAAFVATIRIAGDVCPVPTVVDLSFRGGPVQWIGGNINVPDMCFGFFADGTDPGGGNPITIRGTRIAGTTSANIFIGILLGDEFGGPFLFDNNTITGQIEAGVVMDGDLAMAITGTIRNNRISVTVPGGDGLGIVVGDTPAGSSVLVERNRVNGGGAAVAGEVGIGIAGTLGGVVVRRNTVENYIAAFLDGVGIGCANCDGTQILANVVRNNTTGIAVDLFGGDDSGAPGPAPLVNDNNITSTVAGAVGLDFNAGGAATYNLDAMRNFWGAASGPSGFEDAGTCPEASGPSCLGAGGAGTGLGVTNNAAASADCGPPPAAPPERVMTCPFRTVRNLAAGA